MIDTTKIYLRIYLKEEQQYLYPCSIIVDKSTIIDGGNPVHIFYKSMIPKTYNSNLISIETNSTLCDINDKWIFENDILVDNNKIDFYIIKFEKGCYIAQNISNIDSIKVNLDELLYHSKLKVIGNINNYCELSEDIQLMIKEYFTFNG